MINPLAFATMLSQQIRPPVRWDGATPVFDPPLTAAEQVILDDLRTMQRSGITLAMTFTEWQALKPSLVTCKTYLALTSPTNAQTAAACKAVIRVLATIIRS